MFGLIEVSKPLAEDGLMVHEDLHLVLKGDLLDLAGYESEHHSNEEVFYHFIYYYLSIN